MIPGKKEILYLRLSNRADVWLFLMDRLSAGRVSLSGRFELYDVVRQVVMHARAHHP